MLSSTRTTLMSCLNYYFMTCARLATLEYLPTSAIADGDPNAATTTIRRALRMPIPTGTLHVCACPFLMLSASVDNCIIGEFHLFFCSCAIKIATLVDRRMR